MNKKIYIVIIIVVIILALVYAYGTFSRTSTTPTPTLTPVSTVSQSASGSTFTLADVATHNSAASCWTAIRSGVYDVTSWIDRHPGGSDAILYLCGKDGTSAFTDQHDGQRRPEQELASFKIGDLK